MPRWIGSSYLGALLGNHGHGRATDVAGAHAADLKVPFVAHGLFVFREREKGNGMEYHQPSLEGKVVPSPEHGEGEIFRARNFLQYDNRFVIERAVFSYW